MENAKQVETACIGRVIREFRKTRGITLLELAQKVGVTEGTVSRWETGEVEIAWRHIVGCAAALGCTVGQIVTPRKKVIS